MSIEYWSSAGGMFVYNYWKFCIGWVSMEYQPGFHLLVYQSSVTTAVRH